MNIEDLAPKKLRKRKPKKIIDSVETFESFPVPAAAFLIQVRGPEEMFFEYMCEPYEFNPLALAADMVTGNIFIANAERYRLMAECGYIFPSGLDEIMFH